MPESSSMIYVVASTALFAIFPIAGIIEGAMDGSLDWHRVADDLVVYAVLAAVMIPLGAFLVWLLGELLACAVFLLALVVG